MDANHKGENGDSYCVIQCWGIFADRGDMKSRYRPQAMLIEDNGPALDFHAQFDRPGCQVVLLQPHGDKLARLRRHLDLFRQGRVLLRAGAPFLNELFAEFEGFPLFFAICFSWISPKSTKPQQVGVLRRPYRRCRLRPSRLIRSFRDVGARGRKARWPKM